jgi:DNA repair exonuclease SbcCD ATPase subunit
MDDMDKALEAIKVQIKKEIIDNYFAARCQLEEDHQALESEMDAYRQEFGKLSPLFSAFYASLGQEVAIKRVMQVLSLADWPFYEDFRQLTPTAREDLLKKYRGGWAFTARGRRLNTVLDIYRDLVAKCRDLKEQYGKAEIHLHLLNEDIQKFNQSFDFGLIAAQVEAMEGGGEPICGGLQCGEREELSTRMRFKHKKLTEEELPPPPALPPLEAVKGQIKAILQAFPP